MRWSSAPHGGRARSHRGFFENLESRTLFSGYTFDTVLSFPGGAAGASPTGGLISDAAGNLFGTTQSGGSGSNGTVFEVPQGTNSATVLGTFNITNGSHPVGRMAEDSAGNLYGVTVDGPGVSVIFEWVRNTNSLVSLASLNDATGNLPRSGLTIDNNGNLYGTTSKGGASADGTIFELLKGSSTVTVLASFPNGRDATTGGDLLVDPNGNIYGITQLGGGNRDGSIFELPLGSSTIVTLAAFNGANGALPSGGLVEDANGNLYGVCSSGGSQNDGTVFEYVAATPTITTLGTFNGSNGLTPGGRLVMDGSGNLFGVTQFGGVNGLGTVFEVVKNSGTITTLVNFNGSNGSSPADGLILDAKGSIDGVTSGGGASSFGTIFSLVPQPGVSALLSFISPPTNSNIGGTISTIKVAIEDINGDVVTGDTSNVTIAIGSGPNGAVLSGTTTVAAINGIATFSNLSLNAAGAFTLRASDGGLIAVSSNLVNIPAAQEVSVFRLYNPTSKDHLYTLDANENTTLGASGNWRQEGSPFKVYSGPITITGVTTIPVYRLYDVTNQQHLLTIDANEYATLGKAAGWLAEGIDSYIFPTAVAGSTALYRLSYPVLPDLHVWTTDANENSVLHGTYGWTQEGIIGYVLT